MRYSKYLKKIYISLYDFSDEIIVAEFPKCGGSFLSLTLAHFQALSNDNVNPSIYSINSFVRDLDQIQPLSFFKKSKSNISKTHKNYSKNFKNIVCLTRDPYEVMNSYYRHLKIRGKIQKKITLLDFVKAPKYGISAYCIFLESYYEAPLQSNIMFVKYEDLLKNTYEIIREILLLFKGKDINNFEKEKRNLIFNLNSKKSYNNIENILWKYDKRRKEISIDKGSFITPQNKISSQKKDKKVDEYIQKFISKLPIFTHMGYVK